MKGVIVCAKAIILVDEVDVLRCGSHDGPNPSIKSARGAACARRAQEACVVDA